MNLITHKGSLQYYTHVNVFLFELIVSLGVFDIRESQTTTVFIELNSEGQYVVEDSALLFSGTFERAGHDLVIFNEGADTLRIDDYFLSDTPADIIDGNGAVLRGDLVETLAGPIAPGQYAQAGGSAFQQSGSAAIGQVETLSGTSTVQRTDGTVETLEVGTKIFHCDVVQTEEGGTVSVTFVDAQSSRWLLLHAWSSTSSFTIRTARRIPAVLTCYRVALSSSRGRSPKLANWKWVYPRSPSHPWYDRHYRGCHNRRGFHQRSDADARPRRHRESSDCDSVGRHCDDHH